MEYAATGHVLRSRNKLVDKLANMAQISQITNYTTHGMIFSLKQIWILENLIDSKFSWKKNFMTPLGVSNHRDKWAVDS